MVRLDPFHVVSPTLALYTATVPDWDTVTLACPSLNKVREGYHHSLRILYPNFYFYFYLVLPFHIPFECIVPGPGE